MAALGLFCEEAGAIQTQEQPPDYFQLIAKYEELLESGSFKQAISQIASYPQAQVKVFAGILFSKLLKSNTKHQRMVLEGFLRRLLGDGESMPQEEFHVLMLEKYIEGIVRLDAILKSSQTAHFIANFLANQMFNEGFPFNEAGIFKSYLRLVSRFGSLRMLLALRCADPGDPPTAHQLAALTQVYARKFEHDQVFKAAINQALHGVGFESMRYVVGLIRD
jgi:lysine-N-methylase